MMKEDTMCGSYLKVEQWNAGSDDLGGEEGETEDDQQLAVDGRKALNFGCGVCCSGQTISAEKASVT